MNVLELGVGLRKQADTTVAIDKSSHAYADIVRNVAKRGIPFADNEFDKVYSFEMLEHIESYDDLIFLINEIWRVLKPDGLWHFSVPIGTHGYDHMTHQRIFTKESFAYLGLNLPDDYEHMRISDGIEARFELNFGENPGSIMGEFIAKK